MAAAVAAIAVLVWWLCVRHYRPKIVALTVRNSSLEAQITALDSQIKVHAKRECRSRLGTVRREGRGLDLGLRHRANTTSIYSVMCRPGTK